MQNRFVTQPQKDYSSLSRQELLSEQTKAKRVEKLHAVFIGFLLGIMLYGLAKNGLGIIYVFIPIMLMYGTYQSSQRLKQKLEAIQAQLDGESEARNHELGQ